MLAALAPTASANGDARQRVPTEGERVRTMKADPIKPETKTDPAIAGPFWQRPGYVAAVVCAFVGVALAILPHLIWWAKQGDLAWIASNDELVCYLPVASQAYHNHPLYLSDAMLVHGGATVYPWLQFVPGIAIAKALGLGPLGVLLVWRALAGFSMALGFYWLLKHFLKRPWAAMLLTLFFLADAGMIWARPGFMQVMMGVQMFQAHPPAWFFNGHPVLLLQWRLITPGLSLGYLLLHFWLVARARDTGGRRQIVLAGLSFGLLFHVYFYFWTAAGLGLLLSLGVDAAKRRVYFHTGWIGLLVGLPPLIYNALLTHSTNSDWPQRTNLFITIPRFSELWIAPGALVLILAGLLWVYFRRRELIHIWAVATSGFLLMNHQVITGLQLCNDHYGYVRGIGFSLLFVLLAARELAERGPWPRRMTFAVGAVCALHFSTGVWFRVLECTRSRQPLEIQAVGGQYRSQRLRVGVTPLAGNAVVAGDAGFVDFAQVLENQRPLERSSFLSSSVDNQEWDARNALNSFLLGQDRTAFQVEQQHFFDTETLGPWARDPVKRAQRVGSRLAMFDGIQADPATWLHRFRVRYVALPAGRTAPDYLTTGWRPLQAGPRWDVWERMGRGED